MGNKGSACRKGPLWVAGALATITVKLSAGLLGGDDLPIISGCHELEDVQVAGFGLERDMAISSQDHDATGMGRD
ncbi:MAG: hypothetical protein WD045_06875 [Pirellulaceae bacterium]